MKIKVITDSGSCLNEQQAKENNIEFLPLQVSIDEHVFLDGINLTTEELYDYLDKIDSTVSLLNLINILIDNEITKMLDSLSRLKVKYDSKSLDRDAKNIAENVYTSLKKDSTFSNENIILTDEYIMKHISEESITRLMIRSYTYNSNGVVSSDKPKK